MKNIISKLSLAFLVLTILNACQKVIDIDLNSSNPQYVIIGNIADDGKPCVVEISKTVNFDEASNYPKVKGATVTLSDDAGNTETLLESASGIYESKKILGKIGRTYTLSIKHDGQTFTSISKMAESTTLNTVKFLKSGFGNGPGNTDTLPNYTAIPIHDDKPNVRNYYRYIQTINGVEDKSFLIRNDVFNDGKVNAQPIFSRLSIHLGDKYDLKMQNIDENVYLYFYSLNQSSGNGPGGGTTPSNPPSNITGGGLGYFSAHSVSEISLIVK